MLQCGNQAVTQSIATRLWRDDELVAHKVVKKYVVRGRGRAQPLHLKTRGKSRYGSRLRLANAQVRAELPAAEIVKAAGLTGELRGLAVGQRDRAGRAPPGQHVAHLAGRRIGLCRGVRAPGG